MRPGACSSVHPPGPASAARAPLCPVPGPATLRVLDAPLGTLNGPESQGEDFAKFTQLF